MSFRNYIKKNLVEKSDWMSQWEEKQNEKEEMIKQQAKREIREFLKIENIEKVMKTLEDVIELQNNYTIEGRKQIINKMMDIQKYLKLIYNNINYLNYLLEDKI